MSIGKLIQRHDPWTYGTVRIEGLTEGGRKGAQLPFANAEIIANREPRGHVPRGVATAHMSTASSDDDCEFAFVVERVRNLRQVNVIIRSIDASNLFVEPSLMLGRRHEV